MNKKEFIRWSLILVFFSIGYVMGFLSGDNEGYKIGKAAGIKQYEEKRQDSIIKNLVRKSK